MRRRRLLLRVVREEEGDSQERLVPGRCVRAPAYRECGCVFNILVRCLCCCVFKKPEPVC